MDTTGYAPRPPAPTHEVSFSDLHTPLPSPPVPPYVPTTHPSRPPLSNRPSSAVVDPEESYQARIERLGRQRPPLFASGWSEVGFCFSVCAAQILAEYFVSGFNVIIPKLASELNIPGESTTWPASAFSLVIASTLLVFGRLGDMFGGYIVYVLGLTWLALWSLIAGFSKNEIMLDVCRALQGLGPAAFLPTSMMLLGSIYRPGPRKNLIFGIYGACAPLGFYLGIFVSGLSAQFLHWSWYFYIGAIMSAVTAAIAYATVPSDAEETRNQGVKMDYPGAILIVSGLILSVYAVTASSHAPQRWKTPYISVLLAIGILLLGAAAYVEFYVAEQPLLPSDLFRVKYMKPLTLSLLFAYGVLGVYLLYVTYYATNVMSAKPMQIVAWFTPMALGGLIIATVGGFVLHVIPNHILLFIASVAWLLTPLLFAIAPKSGAGFWQYVFPSSVLATTGIDITFNITNVFITTSLPRRRQGLAGGLINSVLHLGICFFLGFGDVVYTEFGGDYEPQNPAEYVPKYRAVFWFATGLAAVSLVLMVGFVRVEAAKSDLTADEKEARSIASLAATAAERNSGERGNAKRQSGHVCP